MLGLNNDDIKIYRITDRISFRVCDLSEESKLSRGNCTNFYKMERNWTNYYYCNQEGIHFHCTLHPAIEMELIKDDMFSNKLYCPKCDKSVDINSIDELRTKCFKILNVEKFKDAKLIRLDDWYYPEIKENIKLESDYWLKAQVKTDRDGDTIVVLYVGHKGSGDKAQLFIKPEKLQLSNDYKDLDPAKVLAKIELTLKDRTIEQRFDE